MVLEDRGVEVLVERLQDAEGEAVHVRVGAHVRAVDEAVLVARDEPGGGSRGDGRLRVAGRDVRVEVRQAVEEPAEALEVVVEVREVAGDEGGARVAADGALQLLDHAGVVDDPRLVVEPPDDRVHHPVVRLVHLLVHPDGVCDVDVDGDPEVGAAVEERRQPGVVEVQSFRPPEAHPQALVSLLADASRALAHAALELGDRGRPVAGLVVARVVEAAPQLEAGGVTGVEKGEPVELRAVRPRQQHGLLDAHLVHHLHPAVHVLRASLPRGGSACRSPGDGPSRPS